MASNNQKVLIFGGIGAVALLLLMTKKSSSGSTKGSEGLPPGSEGCMPGLTAFGGICVKPKGDAGMPPGPDGCAPGLIVKNGICSLPDTNPKPNDNKPKDADKYNGLDSADSIYVSADCKVIKYGDANGEAWWLSKGKPTAAQWIAKGYNNSLLISYGMLHGITKCLNSFPLQKSFANRVEMETARISWIMNNRPLWNLLFQLRDKINRDYFDGNKLIEMTKNGKFTVGKSFNMNSFWETWKPMAAALIKFIYTPGKDKDMWGYDFGMWGAKYGKGVAYESVKNDSIVKLLVKEELGNVSAVAMWIMFINFSNLSLSEFITAFAPYTVFTGKVIKVADPDEPGQFYDENEKNPNANEVYKYIYNAVKDMWNSFDKSGPYTPPAFPLEQEIAQ